MPRECRKIQPPRPPIGENTQLDSLFKGVSKKLFLMSLQVFDKSFSLDEDSATPSGVQAIIHTTLSSGILRYHLLLQFALSSHYVVYMTIT